MTEKEKKQCAKALAKEIKKGVKRYQPQERKFPLDDAIRYQLTEQEMEAFENQYNIAGIDFSATTVTLEDSTTVSAE